MSEAKAPSNFIRQIIDRDLAEGKNNGRVVTRFPPEPNGYLHIGHAKSICLNFGIAESYGGACHLRFDDTNPEKEEDEYIHSIKKDVEWLGFQWAGPVRFASDYFDQLYDLAVALIRKGLAYVDTQSPERIAEMRGNFTTPGRNSPHRDRSVEENLALFADMRDNKFDEGAAVLRARIDMQSPNLNMRDPVLYRIRKKAHHQTGDKWVIYPMYDFTHPLSDALEGITHSLCTLEFEDHRPLYDWLVEHADVPAQPRLKARLHDGLVRRLDRRQLLGLGLVQQLLAIERLLDRIRVRALRDAERLPGVGVTSSAARRGGRARRDKGAAGRAHRRRAESAEHRRGGGDARGGNLRGRFVDGGIESVKEGGRGSDRCQRRDVTRRTSILGRRPFRRRRVRSRSRQSTVRPETRDRPDNGPGGRRGFGRRDGAGTRMPAPGIADVAE